MLRAHDYQGICLKMKVDIVSQLNRAREPHASRDNNMSAALFRDVFNGFIESLCAERNAVWHSTIRFYGDFKVWESGHFRLCHGRRQIFISVGVVLCIGVAEEGH